MTMDIYFKRADQCFNLRVAGVIKKEDKILLLKEGEHYTLPGGRVQFGETTERALQRMIYDELGFHLKIKRLLSINEHFFTYGNDDYHEVLFIYLGEYDERWSELLKENNNYQVVAMNDLFKFNLKPEFLIQELKQLPPTINHHVND